MICLVKTNLKKNKKVYCAFPPLGFKNQDGSLIVDPEKFKLVEEIKTMRSNGMSMNKIAKYLNNQGVKGSKNGKFHAVTIQKILKNKEYV